MRNFFNPTAAEKLSGLFDAAYNLRHNIRKQLDTLMQLEAGIVQHKLLTEAGEEASVEITERVLVQLRRVYRHLFEHSPEAADKLNPARMAIRAEFVKRYAVEIDYTTGVFSFRLRESDSRLKLNKLVAAALLCYFVPRILYTGGSFNWDVKPTLMSWERDDHA